MTPDTATDQAPPYPHQVEDFREAMSRYGRGDTAVFCEWEAGTGKSKFSVMVAKALGLPHILILCPAIALISWKQQLDAWWPDADRTFIRAGTDVRKIRTATRVVVVTFDLCRNADVRLTLRDWVAGGFTIIDEPQYLRGHASQRTGAAYGRGEGIASYAAKVLLMSGSFVVGWTDDLWTHLARWVPERLMLDGHRMSYEEFRDRFLRTRMVPIPGAYIKRCQIYGPNKERAPELEDRLRGLALYRSKNEIGLPPLSWPLMELELNATDRKRIEDELNDHLPPTLHALAKRVRLHPDDDVAAQQLMDRMGDYTDLFPVAMRVLGVGKAHALTRYLKERLGNSRMAIGIFSINHSVMDAFDAGLADFGVVRIDGSVSTTQRGRAVDAFMEPNGPRVFNGQIQACGTALTLTRASTCYFPQLSPLPGENYQAASRFHRIGQTNAVDAWVPVVRGTLDYPMMRNLRTKIETAAQTRAASSRRD